MQKHRLTRFGLFAAAPLLALLSLLSLHWAATAASPAMMWGQPQLALVVDTTASMAAELNVLAGEIPVTSGPLTATYHLAAFKDNASYLGNTQSTAQLASWVDDLPVGGGGNCPDAAFEGLKELARNTPPGHTPDIHALLVTDATPNGRRAIYPYMVSRMVERGIEVNTLLSGWCNGAPIAPDLLAYLSVATGGDFFPTDGANYDTDSAIALRVTGYQDSLIHHAGTVDPGKPIDIPLPVDKTLTTLGVEDPPTITCPPYCCLTCTMPIDFPPVTVQAPGGVQVQILDPGGNVIGPGSPGYERWESDNRRLQQISRPQGFAPGIYTIRISGSGPYEVEVLGNSNVHMAAEWQPLNDPGRIFLRTTLFADDPAGQALLASGPITCTFKLQRYNGIMFETFLDLQDDGAHRDGQAGDLVFGGVAQVDRPGLYQVLVVGELSDGSRFERLEPAIIRVSPHQIEAPGNEQTLPNRTRTVRFALTNGGSVEGGATTYDIELFSEMGWTVTQTVPSSVTLQPGETIEFEVDVAIPASAPDGAVEETTLVAAPVGAVGQSVTAVATTTVVDMLRLYTPVISRP